MCLEKSESRRGIWTQGQRGTPGAVSPWLSSSLYCLRPLCVCFSLVLKGRGLHDRLHHTANGRGQRSRSLVLWDGLGSRTVGERLQVALRECEDKTRLDRFELNPVSTTNELSDLKTVIQLS